MSQYAFGEPVDEAVCPSPRPSGRMLSVVPEQPPESAASLGALRDRVRRDAELATRHGMLGRYDEPEDPDRGVGLYEALVFQDTAELNDAGWLDRMQAIARTEARLAALKAEAIAGHDVSLRGVSADVGHRYPEAGDRAAQPGERRWVAGDLRSVADEVALVLQLHKGSAMQRIHTSCELVHNFPATLHALAEGELTERAAFTVVRELSVLEDQGDIRSAESAVLEWARKHPLQKIKQAAQREAARRDPAARSAAHARAMDERSVRMFATSDGTAELIHTQDAIDAAAVMTSLDRAAARRRRQGDTRTLDQLRADIALARLLPRSRRYVTTDGARSEESPRLDGPVEVDDSRPFEADLMDGAVVGAEPHVVIHATGAELRALITGRPGTGGEVEHHGPIPQNSLRKHLIGMLARAFLTDVPLGGGGAEGRSRRRAANPSARGAAAFERACGRIDIRIADEPPTGSPDKYVPTAAVDRYVRHRDRTCQFPGCNRPAEFTDLDHRTAFADGGRTTAHNLHCLCRHHHRLKHEGGWTITPNADGTTTWTSPAGRCYRTPPPEPDPPDMHST